MDDTLSFWKDTCARYGWLGCPLAAGAASTLSLGVPHPRYGVMRATMHVTPATSLTRLVSRVASVTLETGALDLPHVYVGTRVFRDDVHGRACEVVGVIVFRGAAGDVQSAPLAVVSWGGMCLPFFEDANDWVMTGWDAEGRVTELFKPFGWGCPAAPHAREATASRGGADIDTQESRVA